MLTGTGALDFVKETSRLWLLLQFPKEVAPVRPTNFCSSEGGESPTSLHKKQHNGSKMAIKTKENELIGIEDSGSKLDVCVCVYLSRQLHNKTSTAPKTKYIAACLGADPLIESTPD